MLRYRNLTIFFHLHGQFSGTDVKTQIVKENINIDLSYDMVFNYSISAFQAHFLTKSDFVSIARFSNTVSTLMYIVQTG